ncbi:type III PLP-dependent enzyme [Shimia aestuarii]|uniref:type III PLP-dependent enzyme n=1 Tax=Shimia aestuarii TaxID=254406 RepID=UPI001FB1D342|nr:type III PLP-dependent enzyme [Shimia aestuarii]
MTMTAHLTSVAGAAVSTRSRLEDFIWQNTFDQPTLVIDTAQVAENYRALKAGLDRARIHYAVKANPAREVLTTLVAEGSSFDAASRGEIEACLAVGARAESISFGNTVKRVADIAFAHQAGVTQFAFDAEEELEKIAEHAPGASVVLRLIVENSEADWPLTRKFGCAPSKALALLNLARDLGLDAAGLSFHVGSQTRRAAMWAPVLERVATVWHAAKAAGHDLRVLNIGGGFPAFYGDPVEAPTPYAANVMKQVRKRFGEVPEIMAEPGRGMVASAGAIAAEVLLVSRKSDCELHRWVYLDIGKFSGLAETMDEAIRYQFATAKDMQPAGPCVLAGPSCDSADVLYEKQPVQLPLGLAAGDKIMIRNCGAYTSSYSSVGFNGFPPLAVEII